LDHLAGDLRQIAGNGFGQSLLVGPAMALSFELVHGNGYVNLVLKMRVASPREESLFRRQFSG
jgi:hypothetical protein